MKKRIIFKKKKYIDELTYDHKIIDSPNFNLINKLPNIYKDTIGNKIKKSAKPKKVNININDIINININDITNININDIIETDIDFDNIIKDNMGGKVVYYDYNKNLIYNEKYDVIGSIDGDGIINME